MTIIAQNEDSFPDLRAVIAVLFPQSQETHSRRIVIEKSDDLSLDDLDRAIKELQNPNVDDLFSPRVVAAVLDELRKYRYRDHERAAALVAAVANFVTDRWDEYVSPITRLALDNPYSTDLLEALPILRTDAYLLSALAARIAHDEHFSGREAVKLLENIHVPSLQSLRVLLVSVIKRRSDRSRDDWQEALIALFASTARGLGWTSWLILAGILFSAPKFAEEPLADSRLIAPSRVSAEIASDFNNFEAQVRANPAVRSLAVRLRDLLDGDSRYDNRGLLDRPAETRAAYIKTLADICGHDPELRHAAIEMLLWLPRDRAVDFSQIVATRLAHAGDKAFFTDLSEHPERLVAYGAEAVRRAAFGGRLERDISMPSAGGSLMESLAEIGVHFPSNEEMAKTWLGDRIAERLIEKTASAVEMRFGKEYVDHSEEGEEKLLAMMFESLSTGFAALDLSLEAIARAASSPRRASVSMRYRTVDKAEEGATGIKKAKSFSADLCLIVDPLLDGRSLGRRVTLVQAKRLYRDKSLKANVRWHHSFQLKVTQISDLMKQTNSSVFLFQGPMLGGRGVPVIPTHLVSALAFHQGGTGTRLARDTVATASRAFADWFTYDLLALRIGDPLEALVTKADGAPGGVPRALLSIPRVEIEIAVNESSEGRRR